VFICHSVDLHALFYLAVSQPLSHDISVRYIYSCICHFNFGGSPTFRKPRWSLSVSGEFQLASGYNEAMVDWKWILSMVI